MRKPTALGRPWCRCHSGDDGGTTDKSSPPTMLNVRFCQVSPQGLQMCRSNHSRAVVPPRDIHAIERCVFEASFFSPLSSCCHCHIGNSQLNDRDTNRRFNKGTEPKIQQGDRTESDVGYRAIGGTGLINGHENERGCEGLEYSDFPPP